MGNIRTGILILRHEGVRPGVASKTHGSRGLSLFAATKACRSVVLGSRGTEAWGRSKPAPAGGSQP